MGVIVNSGSSTITGTVSAANGLPSFATGQTFASGFKENANITAGTPQATSYTVTAGKTFYCLGVNFFNRTGGSSNVGIIKADGTAKYYANSGGGAAQVSGNGSSVGTGILFTATAGQVIQLDQVVSASGCGCYVWGYEA